MHKSSSNVSAVIDLSFSDDDLSIEHEKSKKKVVKNEDEKVAGKTHSDSIKKEFLASI